MKEKRDKKFFIAGLIMMVFSSIISVYAASYLFESEQVSYDNTSSGLTSTNVQDSLDELYNHATDYTSMDTRVSALEDHFQKNTTSKFQGNMLNINSTNSGNRGLEIRDASNLERAYFYYSPSNERVILSTNGQGPLYIQANPVLINGQSMNKNETVSCTLDSNIVASGTLTCVVKNGWAFISGSNIVFKTYGASQAIATGVPKPYSQPTVSVAGDGLANTAAMYAAGEVAWIPTGNTVLRMHIGSNTYNRGHWLSLSYPIQ